MVLQEKSSLRSVENSMWHEEGAQEVVVVAVVSNAQSG